MTDFAGNLLWEFAYQQDGQTDRHWWLTERTADDKMTIEQFATDSSFFEAYTLNGSRYEYQFDTGDRDRIEQLHADMYRNGGQVSAGQLLPADRQTVEQLTAFDDNYEWDNSLHENREGFLVAEFISSVEIAESIAIDTLGGGGNGSLRTLDWDAVCAGASVCAALKCPAGGFANPVCDTCFGVMVVCVVVKIIGSLF